MKKITIVFLMTFVPVYLFAQLSPVIDSIPVRDGKKLAADIYLPDTSGGMTYSTILIQTPYNRTMYRYNLPLGIGLNLSNLHYAIVIVDWRCFYGSFLACVSNPDRGKDGYDVVEWIASQPWSDGKIGTWGASALGKIQFETAKKRPPHLVCSVPIVASPEYKYNEYYPGGDLRIEYLQQLDALGFGISPFVLAHPCYDFSWQYAENATSYPDSIFVPMLMIGGWYDHNTDLVIKYFNEMITESDTAVRRKHKLLMGPWAHSSVGKQQQGELSYPQAKGSSDTMALEFFDYYFHGAHNGWPARPLVRYFLMGENVWKTMDTNVFTDVRNVRLYLKSSGLMEPSLPVTTGDLNTIEYDPRNPSPTHGGATLRTDLLQGPYNQANVVESRNDIMIFNTPVLSANTVLKGKVKVKLFVSTDRKDTDFAVRLTDVYPDGKSMLLADGIARLRFRDGFAPADTGLASPGQVYPVEIEMLATCNTFLAGHKIRVGITSSNFPRYDRNLNNGGRMYVAGDTLPADNKIYSNSVYASYVELPLGSYIENAEERMVSEWLQMEIFPNPAAGEVNVRIGGQHGSDLDVELLDIKGKKLQSNSFNEISKDGMFKISIDDLTPGLYFVRCIDENGHCSVAKLAVMK